jgi:thioredoxin-dependent adenylylsulfate APS reductase
MAAPGPSPQVEKTPSSEVIEAIRSGELERLGAEEILGWAIRNFRPRLALACSFGAPEGLAILDMMHRIEACSRVFVLDTGRLPQSTYDLIDRVRERYGKTVEVVFPRAEEVESMVRQHGLNLFYESVEKRQLCCRIRKVEPLRRQLRDLDAWVSALRRDQNVTRSSVKKVELDPVNQGLVKVNPIADWTGDQVHQYVRSHGVPVNRLHGQGYPSVGCEPCSRAIRAGEDPRAGRWWWESAETKECGIHVGEESEGSGI